MRSFSVSSALVMLTLVSCKTQRDNPNHCQNNDGNDWCAERFPDRPFCSIGACTPDVEDGCVDARPADDACYSPCGDDLTFEDDPSCDGVADSGTESVTMTSSMSDTAPTATTDDPTLTTSMSMSASESETESATETSETDPTTGPTGCVSDLECVDPLAPICDDMECVPCTGAPDGDAACEAKDANAPACRKDGACVQCTSVNLSACDGVTPVCEDASSSCVGCTYHEQCPASACQMATGECFDGICIEDVFDADDIGDVIADGCVIRVHAGAYPESLTITGDTVALLSAGDGDAILGGELGNAAPSLMVSGGAIVYVQGLLINGNDGGGLGIEADGASVYLDRTQVSGNTGGGITLTGDAYAQVRNCFVAGNGAAFQPTRGIDVNGSTLDLIYTSVVANEGNGADSLACTASMGEVRNSILLGTNASSVMCPAITFSNNAVDQDLAGNENVGPIDPDWFESLPANPSLTMPEGATAFGDLAVWSTGDPLVDIEGDARPNRDGAADAAGADVP